MATKNTHTKGLEAAMGMTFKKLNDLRAHACELKAVKKTRYYTSAMDIKLSEVTAQIDAAHAAMADYRTEHNIDAWDRPIKGAK